MTVSTPIFITQAAAAWPDLKVPPDAFLAHLARVAGEDLPTTAHKLHLEDLYLACACALRNEKAIHLVDRRLVAGVHKFVSRINGSPSFIDEVLQRLREKLFVGPSGDAGKIAEYAGRGPLDGWLRVTAVRTALKLRRGQAPDTVSSSDDADDVVGMRDPGADPELDYLKARYANELREVFALALASLSKHERKAVRLHYLDGLTIDETAKMCRVSRSTVARWLADLRRQLLERTRRLLADRLQLGMSEVNSVLHLLESQMHMSMRRHLGGA